MGNKAKLLPSQAELLRVFSYDPLSGVLRWKINPGGRFARIGREAGNVAVLGYRVVTWRRCIYKVHRIAWKMMTGNDAVTVDHIDRDKINNRFVNLRDATITEQNNNRFIFRFTQSEISNRIAALSKKHTSGPQYRRAKPLPPRERLTELFDYDPISGDLIHRTSSMNGKRRIGGVVRTLCTGYYKTQCDGREVYVHRIAWKIMTGVEPENVDHIDGDGINNRWTNLRDVLHHQNLGNMKTPVRNTSGTKGVYWAKDKHRWTAQISIGGKVRYLGRFKNIEDAKKARDTATILHFGFVSTNERKVA